MPFELKLALYAAAALVGFLLDLLQTKFDASEARWFGEGLQTARRDHGFQSFLLGFRQPTLNASEARWFGEELQTARRDHGFQFDPRRPRAGRARGRRGDYEVGLELRSYGQEEREPRRAELQVFLSCPRLPRRVSFAAQEWGSVDILTGDTVFDEAVEVGGDPTILAALLDPGVRVQVRRLVAWGGRLREGLLSWKVEVTFRADELPRTLADVAEVADRLTQSRGGVCERLAQNSREDVSESVRLWNLSLLQQHFPDRPETAMASRAGLADGSPWVRLAAARFLPDRSADTLRSLLDDRRTPDHAAAEVAALVAARLPREDAGPLLVSVLKDRQGECRRQAVQELGRLKYGPSVAALCVLLHRSDPRTAAAAADALGAIGDPKAEARLFDAVSQDAGELRIAAARALGALGTVRAVEPLLERLAQRRMDAESRQALHAAVGAIQSRLAGAETGQLSLAVASTEAGRLSLATPRAGPGDVSLAKEPDR